MYFSLFQHLLDNYFHCYHGNLLPSLRSVERSQRSSDQEEEKETDTEILQRDVVEVCACAPCNSVELLTSSSSLPSPPSQIPPSTHVHITYMHTVYGNTPLKLILTVAGLNIYVPY